MYKTNALKERLRRGEGAIGCWLHMCSPIAAEVVALAGFDAVIIDHEHGSGDLLNAISQLQAVSATPATTLMRVPWNDPVYIKRALDIGVEGVIVPSVDTAEQARAAVAACRYPPAGVRGAAYGLVRASDYGFQGDRYFDEQPDNLMVICQIESVQAVENIETIAAVEGVDMLFVGPFDLSASMGKLGQMEDPEVVALRHTAEARIKDAGQPMGGLAVKGDPPQAMQARGYDLVTAVSDIVLLRDAATAHLRSLR